MNATAKLQSFAAALVLALGGCTGALDEEDGAPYDDEAPAYDDEEEEDEDDEGEEDEDDAGRRDGGRGRPDGGARDSGAGDGPGPSGRDAGPRGDGGMRDAGARDAAVPPSDAAPPAPGNDVPAGEHCAAVASWDPQAVQFEEEVLALTNAARAEGHNCDTEGNFGPAGPLTMEPRLRCAARLHSKYMAESGDFAHTQSATGDDPFDRMQQAGYRFRTAGENIAAGQISPQQVVDGWLESDGHCANIMNPAFSELGVGYMRAQGAAPRRSMPYWTQNFGGPL